MKKWVIFILGLLIMCFGIVLVIQADLGSAPWDVLNIGLYKAVGLSIGSWSIIIGILVLTTSSLLAKAFPKLGAFLNMLLCGIFIDLFMLIPWLKTPASFFGQLLMLLIGIIFMAYGMSIYISARVGTGPRDSLMLVLTNITKIKVQWIRLTMEIVILTIGWLLGGPVGIGTIIFCISIGHITGFALPQCRKLTDSWLENRSIKVSETSSSL